MKDGTLTIREARERLARMDIDEVRRNLVDTMERYKEDRKGKTCPRCSGAYELTQETQRLRPAVTVKGLPAWNCECTSLTSAWVTALTGRYLELRGIEIGTINLSEELEHQEP